MCFAKFFVFAAPAMAQHRQMHLLRFLAAATIVRAASEVLPHRTNVLFCCLSFPAILPNALEMNIN
jgi:hypothetical protein